MSKHIRVGQDQNPLKDALRPTLDTARQSGRPSSDEAAETSSTKEESAERPSGEETNTARIRRQADPETIREQIISEIQEQEALEEFRQNRPDMWVQVMRVGHLLELQEEFEEEIWPEGSCFLYASLPNNQSFCVRKILDVDLETCTVTLAIYADEDLDEGTILIPLEAIAWFGFPKNAVQVGRKRLRGFTAPIIGTENE